MKRSSQKNLFIAAFLFCIHSFSMLSTELRIRNNSYLTRVVEVYATWGSCLCGSTTAVEIRDVDEIAVLDIGKASKIHVFVQGNTQVFDLGCFSVMKHAEDIELVMEYEDGDNWSTVAIGLQEQKSSC